MLVMFLVAQNCSVGEHSFGRKLAAACGLLAPVEALHVCTMPIEAREAERTAARGQGDRPQHKGHATHARDSCALLVEILAAARRGNERRARQRRIRVGRGAEGTCPR